ncbi:hypothetical protein HYH03_015073 [Edaphochlamys debaryana]|uniref:Uncharacterized protein n=1 Tax=Edaphochlamys debaryana TaxID=47281 RepID=A0A836BSX2_9CHLO|nr:hypothetical protein HYH03_015073 [Edaphochlamys debaryana]|eukprot:KAG2486249.1 hypothetical protein HYH03_015073 [Edaphochlamys debaryana]
MPAHQLPVWRYGVPCRPLKRIVGKNSCENIPFWLSGDDLAAVLRLDLTAGQIAARADEWWRVTTQVQRDLVNNEFGGFDEMMVRLQRMMASVKRRSRRQGKRLKETGAELRQRLDDKDREVARLRAALQAAAEDHKRHAASMKMQLSVAICRKEEAEDSMRIMADQEEADAAAVAELRRQLDEARCNLAAAERDRDAARVGRGFAEEGRAEDRAKAGEYIKTLQEEKDDMRKQLDELRRQLDAARGDRDLALSQMDRMQAEIRDELGETLRLRR